MCHSILERRLVYAVNILVVFFTFLLTVQSLINEKVYFLPGIETKTIVFLSEDVADSKVLFNFSDEVGRKSFTLSDVEDAGTYSLEVRNSNGSYIDDNRVYEAIPTWLCKFSEEAYLIEPAPKSYVFNRTAVLPCTILGSPQPLFTWEKYTVGEQWVNVGVNGPDNADDSAPKSGRQKYIISPLGHLYIKYFNKDDTGRYRCRASNICGQRCPDEPKCSKEDVYGDEFELTLKDEDNSDVKKYIMNPVIDNCWERLYKSGSKRLRSKQSCSTVNIQKQFVDFKQYVSLNNSAPMEALFDFRRGEKGTVGDVEWAETRRIDNFHVIEDYLGKSGLCIGRIDEFLIKNMEEYYYCNSHHASNHLIMGGIRFNFVVKQLPYIVIPRGIQGARMAKILTVEYGHPARLLFAIQAQKWEFDLNRIGDDWKCTFNSRLVKNDWHFSCLFNEKKSDIAEFTIDYAVHGDAGYYQIAAGNDEGWTVGPAILLIVKGKEPDKGKYSLIPESVTTGSIAVRWNQPQASMITHNYSVVYRNMEWDESTLTNMTTEEYMNISGLNPGVRYAISVYLEGGLVADEKVVRTQSMVTTAEINSTTCNIGPTHIYCRWDQPDIRLRHGTCFTYKISAVGLQTNKTQHTECIRNSKLDVNITELLPFTKYNISVVACNEVGCSSRPYTVTLKTLEGIPGDVEFQEQPFTTYESIHVNLTKPEPVPGNLTVEVFKYNEHEYRQLNRSDSGDNQEGNNSQIFRSHEFVITELKESTTYFLKFRWKSGAGSGPFTRFYKLTTKNFVNYVMILSICGSVLLLVVAGFSFIYYINRRSPGLIKHTINTVKDRLNPSYMQPHDTDHDWDDDNQDVVIEFVNYDDAECEVDLALEQKKLGADYMKLRL